MNIEELKKERAPKWFKSMFWNMKTFFFIHFLEKTTTNKTKDGKGKIRTLYEFGREEERQSETQMQG